MEQEREKEAPDNDVPKAQGEAADAFSIGELINGQYLVVARTSEGPTGKLYRAQDLQTSAEVTLKLLRGWSAAGTALIPNLKNELSVTRTLARTQSAIAQVHDCDQTTDGRTFLVLERLAGRNLAELIRWREPLSVERALELTIQVARALQAAHSLRLFHGALGAEHVLVQHDDAVKVLGFEVARHELAKRPPTHPPERRHVLTAAGDTRAAAMLLLEMLTAGVRPGPDGTAPDPEAQRGGDVPPEVKQAVMRALITSPEPSFFDMGGLTAALSAELRRRREPGKSRVSRRVRRSRRARDWTPIGVGTVAIVAMASVGLVTWSLVTKSRPPVTHEKLRDSAGLKVSAGVSSPDRVAPFQPARVNADPNTATSTIDRPASVVPPRPRAPGIQTPDGGSGRPAPESPPAGTKAALEAVSPIDRPYPVAPPRPRELATPTPGGGSDRPASESPPAGTKAALETTSPAVDRPAPVAPPRPEGLAVEAPGGGPTRRPESESPDPTAIIDWLLGAKSRSPEQP